MFKRKDTPNPYGICRCEQCAAGKRDFRKKIDRIKKRIRSYYKGHTGKQPTKGIYTD